MFADSQVRFFECMGGCFREGAYNNMRNVVSKFVGRIEKELNPALLRLAAYWVPGQRDQLLRGQREGDDGAGRQGGGERAFVSGWRFADAAAAAQAHLDAILVEVAYAGGTLPPSSMQLFF